MIEIDFFKDIYKLHKKKIKKINNDILIYQIIRDSINLMVKDLIENTIKNIKKYNIKSIQDVYKAKKTVACFSKKFKKIELEIKEFLKKRMYENSKVKIKNDEGKKIIKELFLIIKNKPKKFIDKKFLEINKNRARADFISGMTDRYDINLHKNIK